MNKLILIVIIVLLSACSNKPSPEVIETVIYKDVYLETGCNAQIPPRPKYTENVIINQEKVFEYAEKLEILLMRCNGE